MGERRSSRAGPRTDQQILRHEPDLYLLRLVARGELRNSPQQRMDLRRLCNDGLILVGFGAGSVATMLPRGRHILAIASGEVAALPEDP
jgi:hypothetical protein